MTSTGKKSRKATGLNRAQLHKSRHAHKSARKVRAMGWTRSRNLKNHS